MNKHWKYFKYLMRHKWFVYVAGRVAGVPLWRLIIHDWSKFLPCEWLPYARYFYWNAKRSDETQAAFDCAWLRHQHFNPHHWQYWVLREDSGNVKILEMPDHFRREMLADWAGAGRAITGKWDTESWYAKNRDRILLHPNTRLFVESALNYQPEHVEVA